MRSDPTSVSLRPLDDMILGASICKYDTTLGKYDIIKGYYYAALSMP